MGEPTIATYHSFARRLIDEQGLRVGIEPGARLLSGPAVAQLAYRVVCHAQGLVVTRHGPSRVASDVVRLDANLAEQTITTDELRAHDRAVIAAIDALPKATKAVKDIGETAARRLELADLVDELREAKQASGGLDFSDHMRLCAELVRSSDELVQAMRAAYRVVLLDEYQDTSIAQRVILSTLFAGGGVTAVGDPMQAIYGWRSASVANIDAFAQHFGRDGAAPVRVLSVNRRSGTPILEAANRIADDLRAQHPQVARLRPPEPREAVVRAALLPTVADEREWIADQVRALVESGTPPEHIAILGRANDQLAPLQQLLVARGVPASISGTAALTTSPYATAVLSTLRVLADPADNTSLAALLAGAALADRPARPRAARAPGRCSSRVADRPEPTRPPAARRLRERLREASDSKDPVERPSLLEAAANPGPGVSAAAAARLTEFLGELRLLQSQVGAPLADLVGTVVTVTGARVEADLASGGHGIGDVGLAGLLHLVEGFSDADGRTGLGAFLAYLDAAEQLGSGEDVDLPTMPGSVQLMTMHKAKGLEFPVVVLPHVCRDSFPGGKGSERWTAFAHVVPSELRDDRHVLPSARRVHLEGGRRVRRVLPSPRPDRRRPPGLRRGHARQAGPHRDRPLVGPDPEERARAVGVPRGAARAGDRRGRGPVGRRAGGRPRGDGPSAQGRRWLRQGPRPTGRRGGSLGGRERPDGRRHAPLAGRPEQSDARAGDRGPLAGTGRPRRTRCRVGGARRVGAARVGSGG